jgi:hypothetical protein
LSARCQTTTRVHPERWMSCSTPRSATAGQREFGQAKVFVRFRGPRELVASMISDGLPCSVGHKSTVHRHHIAQVSIPDVVGCGGANAAGAVPDVPDSLTHRSSITVEPHAGPGVHWRGYLDRRPPSTQLLLRSSPRFGASGRLDHETTIDVLVKPVEALRPRASVDGLAIRCATDAETSPVHASLPELPWNGVSGLLDRLRSRRHVSLLRPPAPRPPARPSPARRATRSVTRMSPGSLRSRTATSTCSAAAASPRPSRTKDCGLRAGRTR